MTRLQRLSLASLVVGLILAAFVVPWSLKTVRQTTELLKQQQERVTAEQPPAVDPTVAAAQLETARKESEARAVLQKARDEQTARIKAEMDKLTIPRPVVAPTPEPPHPAYSIVPTGSASLMPLEGWVDQPNKDKPGRVHTNLMVRNTRSPERARPAYKPPCLKPEKRAAERLELPYGWVSVPARTVMVSCQK